MNLKELVKEAVLVTQELVRLKTINPPGNELSAAEFLANWMEKHGFEVEVQKIDKNRGNVIGVIKGGGEGQSLIFNGHLDVVSPGDLRNWSYDPFEAKIVGDKIYGRGSADMKGGIASMAVAATSLSKQKLKGDLLVAAVAGEEIDSIGAKVFAESKWFRNSKGIVIGEPTGMELVITHKGALWLKVTTHGKTAHGSMPHLGVNAILHMVELINMIKGYRFKYEPVELLTPPTLNIGTISGGVETNVVPDLCTITIDIRTLPTQKHEEIINDFKEIIGKLEAKIPNFKAEIEILNNRRPLITDPKASLVLKAIDSLKESLNIEPKPKGVSYYTDASEFIKYSECPSIIIIGPGKAELAHKPNEYIEISALEKAIKFYTLLARKMIA